MLESYFYLRLQRDQDAIYEEAEATAPGYFIDLVVI